MPKKAKRRGRPPGSKNKKSKGGTMAKSFGKLEIGQLRRLIDDLELVLTKKVQHQKAVLQGHLSELQGYVSRNGAVPKAKAPRTRRRAKAKPKYQSKKKPSLKWSGRGMLPVWMREEMKGTKLKKNDFLMG